MYLFLVFCIIFFFMQIDNSPMIEIMLRFNTDFLQLQLTCMFLLFALGKPLFRFFQIACELFHRDYYLISCIDYEKCDFEYDSIV